MARPPAFGGMTSRMSVPLTSRQGHVGGNLIWRDPSQVRGNLMRMDIARNTPGRFSGAAVSADAELLVPDTALSEFIGGRYASRTFDEDSGFNLAVTDMQGFVGVKFALGGPAPTSLRDRDRHGTVDSTSVFQEKLIGLESEVPFDRCVGRSLFRP